MMNKWDSCSHCQEGWCFMWNVAPGEICEGCTYHSERTDITYIVDKLRVTFEELSSEWLEEKRRLSLEIKDLRQDVRMLEREVERQSRALMEMKVSHGKCNCNLEEHSE